MTTTEIARHCAGPELDRVVHERVMGYSPRDEGGWWTQDGEPCPACWSYSTSSAWALIVAETLVAAYHPARWGSFALRTVRTELGRAWHAMFRRDDETAWAEGLTPEEAICRAAVIAAAETARNLLPQPVVNDAVGELRHSIWSPTPPAGARHGEKADADALDQSEGVRVLAGAAP